MTLSRVSSSPPVLSPLRTVLISDPLEHSLEGHPRLTTSLLFWLTSALPDPSFLNDPCEVQLHRVGADWPPSPQTLSRVALKPTGKALGSLCPLCELCG